MTLANLDFTFTRSDNALLCMYKLFGGFAETALLQRCDMAMKTFISVLT